MKTAFIGHRQVFAENIDKRLDAAIQSEINNGCRIFTMGTHGDFDMLALNACRRARNIYDDLGIEVVITSLNAIKKDYDLDIVPYKDVKTVMYDIETVHYKQKIISSNRQMLDTCDTLICYVDISTYRSGAKSSLHYAEKKGLKIINLFRKEDQPYYGMTKEQVDKHWQSLSDRVFDNNK